VGVPETENVYDAGGFVDAVDDAVNAEGEDFMRVRPPGILERRPRRALAASESSASAR
jgi:hypothetical protein